ncbi:MAG: hypothetical protein DBX55_03855 [Verrucomicrobia bacterium]|nr:MAG: hypothetical protein DBX55_03855 [Verrucomicrobiota bacterium]
MRLQAAGEKILSRFIFASFQSGRIGILIFFKAVNILVLPGENRAGGRWETEKFLYAQNRIYFGVAILALPVGIRALT